MDRSKFGDLSPGRLIRLDLPTKKDWTFIPNPLPPAWEFPTSLWPLLVEAKEALGTLNGIGQVLPNPELLLRPLQSREAIESSRIEGTYVTPEQLLLYELAPREPSESNAEAADWKEVWNYSRALRHGCQLLARLPVCTQLIKEMHSILMEGTRGRDKSPGAFRRVQVQIGSNARFVPPPAIEIESLMGNLENFANSQTGGIDSLVNCFLVHYQFEAIHPFVDGNGRVGRALLALMIHHALGHVKPWLYMSAYFERYRDEYYDNLFRVSCDGAWERWIEFCLRGVATQAQDSARRCHRFIQLKTEYQSRAGVNRPRAHAIIDLLFENPVVTITSIARKFDVAHRTARADLSHLVESGILAELSNRRPRSYYAREIIRIAYSDD